MFSDSCNFIFKNELKLRYAVYLIKEIERSISIILGTLGNLVILGIRLLCHISLSQQKADGKINMTM